MGLNELLNKKRCPSCGSYDVEEVKDGWICHYCYAKTLKDEKCPYCHAELYLVDNEVYCAGGCIDYVLNDTKGD